MDRLPRLFAAGLLAIAVVFLAELSSLARPTGWLALGQASLALSIGPLALNIVLATLRAHPPPDWLQRIYRLVELVAAGGAFLGVTAVLLHHHLVVGYAFLAGSFVAVVYLAVWMFAVGRGDETDFDRS